MLRKLRRYFFSSGRVEQVFLNLIILYREPYELVRNFLRDN